MKEDKDKMALLVDAMRGAGAGTQIRVLGDRSGTTGAEDDLELELVSRTWYREAVVRDMEIIIEEVSRDLGAIHERHELLRPSCVEEVAAELQRIAASRERTAARNSGDGPEGPAYTPVEGALSDHLCTLPTAAEGTIYIVRLRLLELPPLAGDSLKVGKAIARALELPTSRYVHAMSFNEHKFGSLIVMRSTP